ncbi:MAG: hypothetical protein CMN21_02725, partial [Rubinisphaera sp.]|nr:hypothetical protein [Rubinisphaera sp.]
QLAQKTKSSSRETKLESSPLIIECLIIAHGHLVMPSECERIHNMRLVVVRNLEARNHKPTQSELNAYILKALPSEQ